MSDSSKPKQAFSGCCRAAATVPDEAFTSHGSMLFSNEAIPTTIIKRNFRSPTQNSSYKSSTTTSAIAVTTQRLLVYVGSRCSKFVDAPWSESRLRKIQFELQSNDTHLSMQWDASLFVPEWSGTLQIILKFEGHDAAKKCMSIIEERLAAARDEEALEMEA